MTTTSSQPTTLSPATVFARASAAEGTRPWTARSTWRSLAAAAGLVLANGAAAGASQTSNESAPVWQPAQIAIVPPSSPSLSCGAGRRWGVAPASRHHLSVRIDMTHPYRSVPEILGPTGVFAALFATSGWLFRPAARRQTPRPDERNT